MAVERFPVEAGHILMFARSIGDPNPVYDRSRRPEVGGLIAPPTFVQASAQFDPDYPLRPKHRPALVRVGHASRPALDPRARTRRRRRRGGGGGGGGGLHAEQHFEYHRARQGRRRAHRHDPARRDAGRSRAGGPASSCSPRSITEYRDQDGELVVTARGVGVRTERPAEG